MARNISLSHLRGVVANMPALNAGEFYFATDTRQLFIGTATGNLNVSGASFNPVAADGQRFVSLTGDDSTGDGLSWGSSFKTIMRAYDDLPSDGGTVFIGRGVSATSTAGQGIWIMASGDPNYSSPPAGWRKMKNGGVAFVGVGGQIQGTNDHSAGRCSIIAGSDLDRNLPAIWLSQINTVLLFENINVQYPKRPLVIGETSNHVRTGGGNGSITFRNCNLNINLVTGCGPTADLCNEMIWIYFHDCGFAGSDSINMPGSDAAAAVLMDGGGNAGQSLIFFRDCNTVGGEIKYRPGFSGNSIFIDGLTSEDQIGPAAAVHFTHTDYTNQHHVSNVIIADTVGGSGPVYGVQVDGNGPASAVLCESVGSVFGPAMVLGQYGNTLTVLPSTSNQFAVISGSTSTPSHIYAQSDEDRRTFGLSAVRYPNLAKTGLTGDLWYNPDIVSVTQAQLAPDGTLNGVALQGGPDAVYPFDANQICNVGDYIILGVWERVSGGFSGTVTTASFISATTGFTFQDISKSTAAGTGFTTSNFMIGDGEWQWVYRVLKCVTIGSNPVELRFSLGCVATNPTIYFAPIFLHIPAVDGVSDNEAGLIALYSKSYSPKALVRELSTTAGLTINVERLRLALGTAYFGADAAIVLSSGWGSTRVVSAAAGHDQALSFTVTSNGTGIALNPTITITFKDGAWAAPPQFVVMRNDVNAPFGTPPHVISLTATSMTITFIGTPVAGTSYQYLAVGMGN